MDRPNIKETLAANVQALMNATGTSQEALANKSGVSKRMIAYVLKKERKATVEVVESLGKAFNLASWQMLIPNLQTELAKSGKLADLVKNYSNSSEDARIYIDQVAAREASAKKAK